MNAPLSLLDIHCSLRDLDILLEVASGHFNAAALAQRIYVGPTAVSAYLSRLRAKGLIEGTIPKHNVRLTERGAFIVSSAKAIMLGTGREMQP